MSDNFTELNNDTSTELDDVESTAANLPAVVVPNLNEESMAIIEQLIAETDEQKARDLTQLFNANQNKKTMVK